MDVGKEITKHLLNGHNCNNCKFSYSTNFCKMRQKAQYDVCVHYKKSPFELSSFIPIMRTAYPNTIASELIGVQPISKSVSEIFKLNIIYDEDIRCKENSD